MNNNLIMWENFHQAILDLFFLPDATFQNKFIENKTDSLGIEKYVDDSNKAFPFF